MGGDSERMAPGEPAALAAGCCGRETRGGERCEPNALASGVLRENDAPQRPVASAIGSNRAPLVPK